MIINTDKAASYGVAIATLKREGRCPAELVHRQTKYLNNVIEADHGKRKRLIQPTLGFQSLKTAYATLKGFEVMRVLKKRQARIFQIQDGIRGEVRLVERAFDLGPNALAEAIEHFRAMLHTPAVAPA